VVIEHVPQALEPFAAFIQGLLGYAEFFLGGIFGLYVILVILRWYESHRLVHMLKDIQYTLVQMSDKLGVLEPERMCRHRTFANVKKRVSKSIKKRKNRKKK